ncbi:hypothetical protein KIN20_034619 [Parelaphostrongylus tenuis]|uniref:Reverse transcriptase domain-containing protein n=1 Tax=Parelaphostrongylus tenuis TaxID=148309 RepID=A0AAD5RAF2_PARTN|nr:hypothetical protein KIN20_034619 [Parelaphostrongylus tenuis]
MDRVRTYPGKKKQRGYDFAARTDDQSSDMIDIPEICQDVQKTTTSQALTQVYKYDYALFVVIIVEIKKCKIFLGLKDGLLSATCLFHGNSVLEKVKNRRWTCEFPNGTAKAETDHTNEQKMVTEACRIVLTFIDCEKAFDSVGLNEILSVSPIMV